MKPLQPRGVRRCLPQFATAFVLALTLHASAFGHVFVDHADPKVGSTIPQSPTEVKVWFTGEVEPAFSGIEVVDAAGQRVDKSDSHGDPKDRSALIVSVQALAAGTYKVSWHAVSADTHKTKGDFKFTVRP